MLQTFVFAMKNAKTHLTQPNVLVDDLSHKSGPKFFTNLVVRNSLKSRLFGPENAAQIRQFAKSCLFHAYTGREA